MLEPVTLANEACAMAGANPVQNLDAETSTAASVKLAYDRTQGFMLGVHPFTWAKSTRQLSRRAGAQPFTGFLYVFDLPADRIGPPIRVTDDASDPLRSFTSYLLETDTVHASAEPLYAQILYLPPPRLWSAPFRQCFVTALAASLALSLKRNRTLAQDLTIQAFGTPQERNRGGQMAVAIAADSYATPALDNPAVTHDPLTSAWRGGETWRGQR
ncbi:MAG: hypothetical protein AB1592_12830 [Pseudomonadota bacterium]